MRREHEASSYPYDDSALNSSHNLLLRAVLNILDELDTTTPVSQTRLFDLGCGNGSVAKALSQNGWLVVGVDPSTQGIAQANAHYPQLKLERASTDDDLVARFGQFPVVISLEVIEHVYSPRRFVAAIHALLQPRGTAIISTPYHGYWKNLALALSGRMDAHFTALTDHGHIKFWSTRTLTTLLTENGLTVVGFRRVGRIPILARTLIAIAQRL